MTSAEPPTIDTLLRLLPMPTVPNSTLSGPALLLQTHLPAHPHLAAAADYNGYTLLHAAASYASESLASSYDLLRALVTQYRVDVNIADNEDDTPLFYAERLDTARILVEELGARWDLRNEEGVTPEENAATNAEDEEGAVAEGWKQVAVYLASLRLGSHDSSTSRAGTNGTAAPAETEPLHHPPPLPPGVNINIGSVRSADALDGEGEPDPEFRARIEALAARPDFQDESGQAELRRLVEDAIGGVGAGEDGGGKRGRVG